MVSDLPNISILEQPPSAKPGSHWKDGSPGRSPPLQLDSRIPRLPAGCVWEPGFDEVVAARGIRRRVGMPAELTPSEVPPLW